MSLEDEVSQSEPHTDDAPETAPEEGGQSAAPEGAEGERKPSRKERRANYATREEAAEAKRMAQEERENRIRLEAQLQEIRQRIDRPATPAAGPTDYDKRIAEARNRWEMHAAAANGAKSQAEARMHLDAVHKAQEDMEDIRDERRWEKRRGELQQSMPNPQVQQDLAVVVSEYPWIRNNAKARAYADAEFNELVRQGKPASLDTLRAAAATTAKDLRLGGMSAPTQSQRRAYDATETRDGESGGTGSGGRMTVEDVKKNEQHRKLALQAYSHLEPEAAYKRFAERIGPQLVKGNA